MVKYYPFLLLLILLLSNCNNLVSVDPEPADLFEIHLQNGFSQTPVRVTVDYSQKFNDTVTTTPALGLAGIIPVQIYKGKHYLSVTVADSIKSDTTFTISDTLYIAVHYNPVTFDLMYYFRYEPFPYR